MLAVGILASGRRLGDTARALAMWMLIILVFVAGYQYRYELQDFANRVTVGLVPGSPLTVNDGGNTVMLEKLANGHFGARGEVNGASVDFIIDTGASSTVLTVADAEAAGFDTSKLSFNVPISTANGNATAAVVVADTVSVGTISRKRVPVFVAAAGPARAEPARHEFHRHAVGLRNARRPHDPARLSRCSFRPRSAARAVHRCGRRCPRPWPPRRS